MPEMVVKRGSAAGGPVGARLLTDRFGTKRRGKLHKKCVQVAAYRR